MKNAITINYKIAQNVMNKQNKFEDIKEEIDKLIEYQKNNPNVQVHIEVVA